CTLDLCLVSDSIFSYRPSLALNAILLVLFALSFLAHTTQGIRWKTWGFTTAMLLGTLAEILGYIGRVLAWNNPFRKDPFMLQIVCLTFAPAFLAAGIYLCLSRVVTIFGAGISRLRPKSYTYIFVGCDFVSLVLQSAGGGIAASADTAAASAMGNNIMLAGLAFQVATLALFMALCAEYAWRVRTSGRVQMDPVYAHLRGARRFRMFLGALAASTLLIQVRSIFRVVEMAAGWDGPLMRDQTLFFVLEGVMVILAVLVLNAAHPGW
ncbi:RTA1 like protein-domain-containing protein, partial [Geopyxis carbonaria]